MGDFGQSDKSRNWDLELSQHADQSRLSSHPWVVYRVCRMRIYIWSVQWFSRCSSLRVTSVSSQFSFVKFIYFYSSIVQQHSILSCTFFTRKSVVNFRRIMESCDRILHIAQPFPFSNIQRQQHQQRQKQRQLYNCCLMCCCSCEKRIERRQRRWWKRSTKYHSWRDGR